MHKFLKLSDGSEIHLTQYDDEPYYLPAGPPPHRDGIILKIWKDDKFVAQANLTIKETRILSAGLKRMADCVPEPK